MMLLYGPYLVPCAREPLSELISYLQRNYGRGLSARKTKFKIPINFTIHLLNAESLVTLHFVRSVFVLFVLFSK